MFSQKEKIFDGFASQIPPSKPLISGKIFRASEKLIVSGCQEIFADVKNNGKFKFSKISFFRHFSQIRTDIYSQLSIFKNSGKLYSGFPGRITENGNE